MMVRDYVHLNLVFIMTSFFQEAPMRFKQKITDQFLVLLFPSIGDFPTLRESLPLFIKELKTLVKRGRSQEVKLLISKLDELLKIIAEPASLVMKFEGGAFLDKIETLRNSENVFNQFLRTSLGFCNLVFQELQTFLKKQEMFVEKDPMASFQDNSHIERVKLLHREFEKLTCLYHIYMKDPDSGVAQFNYFRLLQTVQITLSNSLGVVRNNSKTLAMHSRDPNVKNISSECNYSLFYCEIMCSFYEKAYVSSIFCRTL